MMDNFQTELVVLGAKVSLRDFQLPISYRKMTTFSKFNELYGKMIMDV
jgi:hypothetical protein